MSIPLRKGFVEETLERCLEDLLVRFILNCPEEDLSSIERVLFQIEEAHWFYQDFLRTLNPLLPSMKMKVFTNKLIEQCPLIWKWGEPSEALAQFGKYKSTIPVRGCALLNESMDKILLVKGIESPSWGFPRGKISKDESDVNCALRELDEETGFDASGLIDEDVFVERTIKGKNYKIFIIKGVPETYQFVPKVRYEIADIQWMDIRYLTKAIKTTNNFYLVSSMLKPITSYINRIKNTESEEELKRLATTQLKKLLGIDSDSNEKEEAVDPGRELLALLKSVGTESVSSTAPLSSSSASLAPTQNASQQGVLPPGLTPQQQLHFQQQQIYSQLQQRSAFNPFLPPSLLAYQQNRMIPIAAHNPFPLQMFNPYHSFPPYGMSQPISANFTSNFSSQEMAAAPSASTLAKPQFAQKPNHQNSKELLNILKKPAVKQSKKLDSAELLDILKKDTQTSKVSTPPPAPISILKREARIQENGGSQKNLKTSGSKQKGQSATMIDITEPANITTSRDIQSPILNGKPVVLLRKGTPTNKSKPFTSNMNRSLVFNRKEESSIATPELSSNSIEVKSASDSVVFNDLHLLNKSGSDTTNDPSAQLLNILQKKTSPAPVSSLKQTKPTDPSLEILNLLKSPSVSEREKKHTNVQTSSDPSKSLLDILKSPTTNSLLTTGKPAVPVDPSKDLLNLLKTKQTTPVVENVISEPSSHLFDTLRASSNLSPSFLVASKSDASTNPDNAATNDPSKNLLDMLKPQKSTPVLPSSNLSNDLLNLLKQPQPQSAQSTDKNLYSQIIEKDDTERNRSSPLPDTIGILQKSIPKDPETIETFQNFDEWEDEEDNSSFEDAAEYADGDLYAD